ncbi:peptidylprolyl isomerase [Candidatus Peregrinibacteria bacterium CG11_big_fil_rev_8_21_14_0_20_46_8]|nr:MAG: peptidylprolyl isomerase [Candidatus Peregrinibacteria bacterium CG11_big_fil_rev_8_21_14_0_20_46_8]
MEDKFSHQAAAPKSGDTIATMTTNKGVIKIRFFAEQAPKTVENFTELAKKGFYDGLTFHRVIPNFMIQGGDPDGNGTGGETWNNEVLLDEFSDELTHLRGSLSMANRGPNTGTSQFFIVQNPQGTPFLDGRHAVFGQVYEGLEVVDAIVNSKRDGNDKPIEPVIMEKVEISTL